MTLTPRLAGAAVGLLFALIVGGVAIAVWQAHVAVRQSDRDLCPVIALVLAGPRPHHMTPQQARGYTVMAALGREYGC